MGVAAVAAAVASAVNARTAAGAKRVTVHVKRAAKAGVTAAARVAMTEVHAPIGLRTPSTVRPLQPILQAPAAMSKAARALTSVPKAGRSVEAGARAVSVTGAARVRTVLQSRVNRIPKAHPSWQPVPRLATDLSLRLRRRRAVVVAAEVAGVAETARNRATAKAVNPQHRTMRWPSTARPRPARLVSWMHRSLHLQS